MKTSEILRNSAWFHLWEVNNENSANGFVYTCSAIEVACFEPKIKTKIKVDDVIFFYNKLFRSCQDYIFWVDYQLKNLDIFEDEVERIQNIRAQCFF